MNLAHDYLWVDLAYVNPRVRVWIFVLIVMDVGHDDVVFLHDYCRVWLGWRRSVSVGKLPGVTIISLLEGNIGWVLGSEKSIKINTPGDDTKKIWLK